MWIELPCLKLPSGKQNVDAEPVLFPLLMSAQSSTPAFPPILQLDQDQLKNFNLVPGIPVPDVLLSTITKSMFSLMQVFWVAQSRFACH